MKRILNTVWNVLSSLGLSCVLLILLGLLTWLGTLEQVDMGLYDVQKKYFESFVLVHRAGPLAIPLPGANLVLTLLFVNLVAGGIVRMRKDARRAGILVAHVGIGLLLLSGFVKLYFSQDGNVALFPGERADHFQSHYRWELALTRELPDGRLEERVVPQQDFAHAKGDESVTLVADDLPFALEVRHVMTNSRVLPKGPRFDVDVPVVDGLFLREEPRMNQAEQNAAGAYVTVVADGERRDGLLWGRQRAPWTVDVDGTAWAIDLRKERYPMPFAIVLDEFVKEEHPRTNMPRTFASDVTVIEHDATREVTISMNEPLRDEGLVLYQSSWGPSNARPGEALFSVFSVVRNPADQYPLWACIVIGAGLILHYTKKLQRYIRSEVRS